MTDTPKKLVVNIATGKQEYIDLTAEEIAQRQADAVAAEARKAEEDAKAASDAVAKDALLTKLGITADEAKLLLA